MRLPHGGPRHAAAGETSATIAVPAFVNQTQTYRMGKLLTRDVVRELIGRTNITFSTRLEIPLTPREMHRLFRPSRALTYDGTDRTRSPAPWSPSP